MDGCEDQIRPKLEESFNSGLRIHPEENWCKVVLPLERADFDKISLWVQNDDRASNEESHFIISDAGETFALLYLSNVNIERDRQEKRIKTIKQRYDLSEAENEVRLRATEEDIGDRILDAAQAVKALSELTLTRRPYSRTAFTEEVGTFLDELGYEYESDYPAQGTSRKYTVDFKIQRERPTFVHTIHGEKGTDVKYKAERTGYMIIELRETLNSPYFVSVLDDEGGVTNEDTESILENRSDAFVPWSEKNTLPDAIG